MTAVPLSDSAGAADALAMSLPQVAYQATALPSAWHADSADAVHDWSRITIMTNFKPVAAISTEDVNILWRAEIAGVAQDPTLLTPQFAVPVSSGNSNAPAQAVTWYTGTWLAGSTIALGSVAQFKTGTGGLFTLSAGTVYDVWSRLTGGSGEAPAKFVGQLRAY